MRNREDGASFRPAPNLERFIDYIKLRNPLKLNKNIYSKKMVEVVHALWEQLDRITKTGIEGVRVTKGPTNYDLIEREREREKQVRGNLSLSDLRRYIKDRIRVNAPASSDV